jgi:hypothetical protein
MWTNMADPDRPQMTTAHSHFMLDKQDYKRKVKICYIYYFATAATVARTRLNVMLYALFTRK